MKKSRNSTGARSEKTWRSSSLEMVDILLTALRALLAPILVVLALCCANRIALGACLVWADHAVDWLDRTHPLLRALKVAGVIGGASLVYVAVLAAVGLKVTQFARKA